MHEKINPITYVPSVEFKLECDKEVLVVAFILRGIILEDVLGSLGWTTADISVLSE